jgi:PAS domain S-box-containing protein
MLIVDADGMITVVNRQVETLLGYEKSELIGQAVEVLIPERYRAHHPALRQGYVQRPSVRAGAGREVVGLRKDGTEIPMELGLTPINLDGGVHVIGTIVDITERKRAEATLLEQKALLREIVNGALDAIVTIDAGGSVLEWNPQAESIFGFSRDEAMGRRLTDMIIPARYREAHTMGIQRFIGTGQTTILRQRIEITALRKNGDEFPVELTVVPFQFGNQVLCSSFIRDISEHKRTLEQLRQSSAFIESVLEHLPNMVFVKDAKDLRFVRFNKAGEKLLGYSRAELLGKNDYDFFPKVAADFFTTKDRETLRSKQLTDIPEEPLQTKSKDVRILHTKKIPICDSAGEPLYLLGISEDITERKQVERALLEARVDAEEANRAKSDFLANMSHEMRTPLNAIVGITDFLSQADLSPEQLSLVRRCAKASDGLLRMIEELLMAAKAESGTLRLVDEPFQLTQVVSESVALLHNQAQDKGLSLTAQLDPSLPPHVIGDAHRLQQILLNLMRNAIKFTSTGAISIHVSVLSREDDRHIVLFKVIDTGTGIPSGQEEHIFKRFSQADSRQGRQSGGVGLGLAICKELVGLMRGEIRATNNPGGGSTFAFTVELKSASLVTPPSPPADRPLIDAQARGKAASIPPLHILLAEDFIESQDIMRLYLRDTPHHLDCAATGIEVVTMFQKRRYDLVFMDLHMPDLDGYTATCVIRTWEQQQGRPPTPIIALTANGLTEARIESQAAGCDEFLTKPIKMETLRRVIERYATGMEVSAAREKRSPVDREQEPRPREVKELKRRFIANRMQELPLLQEAAADANFEHIRTIGHRIKGLAGSYGLDAIGAIGAAMEEAALAHDAPAVSTQIAKLTEAVRLAEAAPRDDADASGRAA